VSFNSTGWAAPSLATLCFIGYFSFACGCIDMQNFLRAKLFASAAADAKIFISQDNLVHIQIFNQNIGSRPSVKRLKKFEAKDIKAGDRTELDAKKKGALIISAES
jgi:hypothetical protein